MECPLLPLAKPAFVQSTIVGWSLDFETLDLKSGVIIRLMSRLQVISKCRLHLNDRQQTKPGRKQQTRFLPVCRPPTSIMLRAGEDSTPRGRLPMAQQMQTRIVARSHLRKRASTAKTLMPHTAETNSGRRLGCTLQPLAR